MLPLIVVAASDDSGQGAPPGHRSLRDQLVEELRHRYDRDYDVVGSDPEQITGLLREMSPSARPVAAVSAGSDQEAGPKAAIVDPTVPGGRRHELEPPTDAGPARPHQSIQPRLRSSPWY